MSEIMKKRTEGETAAYLQGFKAGAAWAANRFEDEAKTLVAQMEVRMNKHAAEMCATIEASMHRLLAPESLSEET